MKRINIHPPRLNACALARSRIETTKTTQIKHATNNLRNTFSSRTMVVKPIRFSPNLFRGFCSLTNATEAQNLIVSQNQKEPESKSPHDQYHVKDPRVLIANYLFNTPEGQQLIRHHGWTSECLSVAAAKLGYPPIIHGVFVDGPVELAEMFVEKCNKLLVLQLQHIDLKEKTLKEKLRTIIQLRLQMNIPFIQTWPQVLGLFAHPANIPRSLHHAAVLVDEIAHQSGDKSTDINWYAKRAAIFAIYSSTEVFMLTDASLNFQDTWDFLDRRLDDLIVISKTKDDLEKFVTLVGKGAYSVVTSGVQTGAQQIVQTDWNQVGKTAFGILNNIVNAVTSQTGSSSSNSNAFHEELKKQQEQRQAKEAQEGSKEGKDGPQAA